MGALEPWRGRDGGGSASVTADSNHDAKRVALDLRRPVKPRWRITGTPSLGEVPSGGARAFCLLWPGPASRLLQSEPPSGRNPRWPLPQEWICTGSNCVDCQAVFAGKPAPTVGSRCVSSINVGCQAITGASSLATGPASRRSCVDTYAAIAVCQLQIHCLALCIRNDTAARLISVYMGLMYIPGYGVSGRSLSTNAT